MGAIVQEFRYSLRALLKKPSFTLIAVATLALGVGVNTSLFSVVKAVLLNALPYRQPDRLVTLAKGDSETPNPTNTSFATTADWRSRTQSFQSIALYRGWGPTLTGNDSPELLHGIRVTQNFFETLGVQPSRGREFLHEEDHPDRWHVVLLTHSYWVQRFAADPKVLGATLMLDDVPFHIVGVLPQTFESLSFSFSGKPVDVWAPLGYDLSEQNACRTCQHLRSVARLKGGVSIGQARAEMRSVEAELAREFPKEYPTDATVVVLPLRDAWVGKVRSALWLLLGATFFVLLIACANIANLQLARATEKRREIAVRSALGASRWRIARQLIAESLVLSILGGAVGVVLALWGTSFLIQKAPTGIPRLKDVHFDVPVLLFSLFVCVATGILMGLVPAIQAARVDQREALQQQGSRGTEGAAGRNARSSLVISEVALAFALTIASGLFLKSFMSVLNVKAGFEPQNISTIDFILNSSRYSDDKALVQMERNVLDRVRTLPGVESVAIADLVPGSGAMGNWDQRGFIIKDRHTPDAQVPSVDSFFVSPGYMRTMQIPIKRGRDFTEADAESAAPVALISESAAREIFAGEEALGRHIQLGGRHDDKPWATIVGIVGDVHQYGLDSPVTPQAYALYNFMTFSGPTLVIRSNIGLESLMNAVREQIWGLDKNVPVTSPWLMTDYLSRSLDQRQFTTSLLAGFGALSLLLATLGIYGVTSYVVAQRTKEFGIRIALGAQRWDILGLVSREGMLRAGIGLVAGFVLSIALARVLASQLFAVSPFDPLTFGVGVLLLGAVALLACYVPARRATRVDPMVALHYE